MFLAHGLNHVKVTSYLKRIPGGYEETGEDQSRFHSILNLPQG